MKEDVMKDDPVRDAIVDVLITATQAQLRALRRLKKEKVPTSKKRRSNLSLIEDVLERSSSPLHVTEIIDQVQQIHGIELDRESIVSSLTKKVHRKDRFCRTAPNTFGLIGPS
jgi:hypothetical protein